MYWRACDMALQQYRHWSAAESEGPIEMCCVQRATYSDKQHLSSMQSCHQQPLVQDSWYRPHLPDIGSTAMSWQIIMPSQQPDTPPHMLMLIISCNAWHLNWALSPTHILSYNPVPSPLVWSGWGWLPLVWPSLGRIPTSFNPQLTWSQTHFFCCVISLLLLSTQHPPDVVMFRASAP